MNRPVILLDQDGPLADFDKHFWDRCQDRGYTFDIQHCSEQRHYYFSEHIVDERERAEASALVDQAGWFYDLPVTPGAQEGVAELMELADVWVCTKPNNNPTVRDDKVAWLKLYFPDLAEKCIIAPNKGLVHGSVLLDDHIRTEWLPYATWAPVVYPTPFNGPELPGVPRWTWGDYPDDLVEWARRNSQAA